jgi:hypothetical protein
MDKIQQPIIDAIPREVLLSELTEERFVRHTNKGNNEIYIVDYKNSPNTLREIGRLRELAFREGGGGSGLDCDLDELDTSDEPYKQIIVWSPEDQEIIGGYRYLHCGQAKRDEHGHIELATAHLFDYSDKFINNYLPYTIELGRSFVQPKFQPGNSRKGIFSLDNTWDGLGAIVVDNPDVKYLFGKFTMYTDFDKEARNLILYFLQKYFPDNEGLMKPFSPLTFDISPELKGLFHEPHYKEAFKTLVQKVRERGANIPPLVNIYMNLSDTMKTFGTAINHEFGGVEETGILVTIADIYPEKKERHLNTYLSQGKK